MKPLLSPLGVACPVLAAPMSGGPMTPALVTAAARAGSLGFLAGGYKTPALVQQQIAEVREQTPTFGVNLFAPNPVPVDPGEFRRYAAAIQAEAGTLIIQTVTSAEEARLAAEAGADALAVRALAAGVHSGTLTPRQIPAAVPLPDLAAAVAGETGLPVVAAGGLSTPAEVAAVLQAGASAVGDGLYLRPYRRLTRRCPARGCWPWTGIRSSSAWSASSPPRRPPWTRSR